MTACHAVNMQSSHSTRSGEFSRKQGKALFSIAFAACALLLAFSVFAPVAVGQAKAAPAKRKQPAYTTAAAPPQNPQIVTCPAPEQALITMPEIASQNGRLRAGIKLTDGLRTVWGAVGVRQGAQSDTRCASQYMRFFEGINPLNPQPWPAGSDPIPGPTLRAHVGDLVEITFQNLVNPQHFANSLDQGELGNTPGCDQYFGAPGWQASRRFRNGFRINPTVNNPGGYVFTVTAVKPNSPSLSGATAPNFPQTVGATVQDNDLTWTNQAASNWTANNAYSAGSGIQPLTNNPGGYVFIASQGGTSGATAPNFPQTPGQTVKEGTASGGGVIIWTNSGKQLPIYPGGDTMPNCLHGSSTANIHFHGTHTTPSTTGDNVLLYIQPASREGGKVDPGDTFVATEFNQIFNACERDGTPTKWQQLPAAWRNSQEHLLQQYDATAPYKGVPGNLPVSMQLWPPNAKEIAQGLWPQYQVGAYPFCFRLAVRDPKLPASAPAPFEMGQAPGTHWYHAHKHGSTALNVANGMTGAFIIEGPYDADLKKFYGQDFESKHEKVLMLQQLSTSPFPVTNPLFFQNGPGAQRAPISVNGRRNPVITMQPGEVQLWRIVNGAFRDGVRFLNFTGPGSTTSCTSSPSTCVNWRQIAQDGVQFAFKSYNREGKQDNQFNLAPANRADLLVQAPAQPGVYTLQASANEGSPLQSNDTSYTFTLLTVNVAGAPLNMSFIENEKDFPEFPGYLSDIPESSIFLKRNVVFSAGNTNIDGQAFDPNQINQAMLLNTAEEWTVRNQANDKSHPFHIHINPFQITELFVPNSAESKDPTNPCYADPARPDTWKPCHPLSPPFVWWDAFAIPAGRNDTLKCTQTPGGYTCPSPQGGACSANNQGVQQCSVNIPGYFKMRSRFVDFTGQYVLHCHILIHEDRGMMQLVEVIPNTTLYTHH